MRRFLRDRYVGAVLLGFLLYNFIAELIRAAENPILTLLQRSLQHSAMMTNQPWFNKGQLFASLIDAGFYLLAALIIGFWVYWPSAGRDEAKPASK